MDFTNEERILDIAKNFGYGVEIFYADGYIWVTLVNMDTREYVGAAEYGLSLRYALDNLRMRLYSG